MQISNRIYTRIIEVDPDGKITYEYIGGLYTNQKEQMQKCGYRDRIRFYASSKNECIELLKTQNRYTEITKFQDELILEDKH